MEQSSLGRRWLIIGTALFVFLVYVAHMQLVVNALNSPYTTDVGEIQNALPRWGTLHFTGYPQYTFLGSLFVTLGRWLGLAPAAGASLYSAVWGAISIALLVWLMLELDVPGLLAAISAVLFGLSASMWVDSAIAEVHTMTMALTIGALLAAVRLGRDGQTRDLYWLAFLCGQGLVHQRAFAFIGLGLLILVAHQWRVLLHGKHLFVVLLLALLGPITYLYLPLRAWMGADWTFSSPGTWAGFKALVLDTKAERIVDAPTTVAALGERIQAIFSLLRSDWPWPAWLLGLLGLFLPGRSWRIGWGLTLSWLPYFLISLIIWEGRVSDALLAVKMPVIMMSAIGLAFAAQSVWLRTPLWRYTAVSALLLFGGYLFVSRRPLVLAITRDDSAYELIEQVAAIPLAADGRPQTLMALWGDDFWPLAYAQTFEGYFPDLNIVQHDLNFGTIVERGDHLLTLSRTFYERPVSWWQELLGPVYLTSAAPEIVEIQTEPMVTAVSPASNLFDLGNGIAVQSATLTWVDDHTLHLRVAWQAQQDNLPDYSIAVHLVAQDPPTGPQDILAQADSGHPVEGWYSTSLWQQGEVVVSHLLLTVPNNTAPKAVRVAMYRALDDGTFMNSEWLSLSIP